MSVHLVLDTTASLPQSFLEALEVPIIPQYVHFGERTFRDQEELTPAEFYRRQAQAYDPPRTSAPSPAEFVPIFNEMLGNDPSGTILCVHPSAEVSGTVRSAEVARDQIREEHPDADVRIFDTRSVSAGLGLMAWEAVRRVEEGTEAESLLRSLAFMRDHMRVFFVVDTLRYLAAGGRIGRASHLVGSLLEIKPILTLDDGVVAAHSRSRTRKRAVQKLRELAGQAAGGRTASDRLLFAVAHAVCEEEAAELCQDLETALDPDVSFLAEIGPSIGVHAGPGTLAIALVRLPPKVANRLER